MLSKEFEVYFREKVKTGLAEDTCKVQVYRDMKFRSMYNLIEDPVESHLVIEQEIKVFSKSIKALWMSLGDFLLTVGSSLLPEAKERYGQKRAQFRRDLTLTKTVFDSSLQPDQDVDIDKLHRLDSEQKRKQEYFLHRIKHNLPCIQNKNFFLSAEYLPVIYQDYCYKELQTPPQTAEALSGLQIATDKQPELTTAEPDLQKQSEEVEQELAIEKQAEEMAEKPPSEQAQTARIEESAVDLVYLCHGMQGCHEDMLRLKMFISLQTQNSIIHAAQSYEQDTGAEIYLMGRRFAEEVVESVARYKKQSRIRSINFIAFSLGSRG